MLSNTPTLSFSLGDQLRPAGNSCIWAVHAGQLKADKSEVTVFVFDVVKQRDKLGLARNFHKRFKSIKHPLLPKVGLALTLA